MEKKLSEVTTKKEDENHLQQIVLTIHVYSKQSDFTKFHFQKTRITFKDGVKTVEQVSEDSDSDSDSDGDGGNMKPNLNKMIQLINPYFEELSENNTKMFVDGKEEKFSFEYKFTEEGMHKVKFEFNHTLKTFSQMFQFCIYLDKIEFININSEKIEDFDFMFSDCKSLDEIKFNRMETKNAKNMYFMFSNCYSLLSLDLSSFNTENVQSMGGMFNYCISLKEIDVSEFNLKNLIRAEEMFLGCKSVVELDLSNFCMATKLKEAEYMFTRCDSLKSLCLPGYILKKNEETLPKGIENLVILD